MPKGQGCSISLVHGMAVPIDNLGLKSLLKERVYTKWVDNLGESFTLGSRSHTNKEETELLMEVVCDSEAHIRVHFSLDIFCRVNGKQRPTQLLLVVPPHGDFNYALKSRPIRQLGDFLHSDAVAVHDAGIIKSEQIHVLPFNLRSLGFVVKKTRKLNTPSNSTSKELARMIRSLSLVKTFKVYIKPSDYAQQNLKTVWERLSGTGAEISISNMMDMYSIDDVEVVDWTKFGLEEFLDTLSPPIALPSQDARVTPNALPPPYAKNDAQRSTGVEIPQSPPNAYTNTKLVPNIGDAIVPATPSSLPVCHGIFSPEPEKQSKVAGDSDLDDIHKDSGHVENFELDSDEERLAALNAQQLSQQLRQKEISDTLLSRFRNWLNATMAIDGNVYKNPELTTKLRTLGTSVRNSEVGLFEATKHWCSALFLFKQTDASSQANGDPSKQTDGYFVSDMAELIKWVNKFHRDAEVTVLKHDFLRLGSAARACDTEQYMHHKCEIILRIFVSPTGSNKVWSGKRKFSEIGSIGCE
ncbi:hypothetical protein ACMFMG_012095 [Clarireedia jacksonii]